VNLTALAPAPSGPTNPIAERGLAILAAVAAKEAVVSRFRALSQQAHAKDAPERLKEQLAEVGKTVEAADVKIREAAKPQKLSFELAPVQ
jgi:hypothetical protein